MSMPFRFGVILLSLTCFSITIHNTAAQEKNNGVVTGWGRNDGRLLLGELNCVACHDADKRRAALISRQAPILTEVGKRITPQFLRAYLKNPHKVKPGTPMPNMLHTLKPKKRAEVVEDLVHYLTSLGGPIDQKGAGASAHQIAQGKRLYHRVGCVACHQPFADPPETKNSAKVEGKKEPKNEIQTASILFGDLANKTTVEQLAEFLRNPLHTRPSGRMPSLNLNLGEARMIASYLLREQLVKDKKGWGAGLDVALYRGAWNKVPDFSRLTPVMRSHAKSFDLRAVSLIAQMKKKNRKLKNNFAVRFHGMVSIPKDGRYVFGTRSDDGSLLKINGKVVVNNDGNHPPRDRSGAVQLQRGRHAIEVGFQQRGGGFELSVWWQPPGGKKQAIPPDQLLHGAFAMIPKGAIEFNTDKTRAKRGRAHFLKFGCVQCHQVGKPGAASSDMLNAPPLVKLTSKAKTGCLGEKTKAGAPRFALNKKQRKALQQALRTWQGAKKPLTANQRIHQTMAALNCYACHQRGKFGGPDALREPYFTKTVAADLGQEGRLPPLLHEVGAKLTKKGFADYLVKGARVRYYMATRMPLFGKDNVGHLQDLFLKADGAKIAKRVPAFTAQRVDAGRFLAGKKALGCISCHSLGKYKAQGVEGLDLLQVPGRLHPGWFHALLRNPAKHLRPQTKMPSPFPNGQTFYPKILAGDVQKQIDGLWSFLLVGEKGGLPAGLTSGNQFLLVPTNEPIVFRTFLHGVGAKAIAVGFPQRVHIAFDAVAVRMAKAWVGEFLDAKAAWAGRAGQYAKIPAQNVVDFPADSPFAILVSQSTSWPKLEAKIKNTPKGWRFRGYRFNEKRIPTFLYRFQEINVEETPSIVFKPKKAFLKRSFQLNTEIPVKDLWFRIATGRTITKAKNGSYRIDDRINMRIQAKPAIQPVIRSSRSKQTHSAARGGDGMVE